jgi:hypothetical protein
MMKRLDENRVSLVEFLRSIKYSRHGKSKAQGEYPEHFAGFSPQVSVEKTVTAEDSSHVLSGN